MHVGFLIKGLEHLLRLAGTLFHYERGGLVERDAVGRHLFRNRHILAVVLHIGPEAAYAHTHLGTFPLAQHAWHVEELESLLEGDGGNALVLLQRGKAWLVVVVGAAQLHQWSVAANLHRHGFASGGVVAQHTLSHLVLEPH